MISKEIVNRIVAEYSDEIFIVELKISSANKITVYVDSIDGITIDNCVEISRHIENNLDRDDEDYELEVSSAGLQFPLKDKRQYMKNINRKIEVICTDGTKIIGKLCNTNEQGIEIESKQKKKTEGSKKKQLLTTVYKLTFDQINTTKVIPDFSGV